MKITEVRVNLRDDVKLKAFASIVIDEAFVVRGLKIIEGKTGLFVAMPSRKRRDGEYQDIVHPVNAETREQLEKVVLEEYRRVSARPTAPPDAATVPASPPPSPDELRGTQARRLDDEEDEDGSDYRAL